MKKKIFVFLFFLLDVVAVTFSFIFVAWLKPNTREHILPTYFMPFLGFFVIWMVISLIGKKYFIPIKFSLKEALSSILKINFMIMAITLILIFFFKRYTYSRLIVFGTILLASFLELLFLIFFYIFKVKNGLDESSSLWFKPRLLVVEDKPEIKIPKFPAINPENSILKELGELYLQKQEKLNSFIKENIPLEKISRQKSQIVDTHTLFNLKNVHPQSQQFVLNLHKVNDFRRLNEYFIQINQNLQLGGYFAGRVETIAERYKKYFDNLPIVIALPFYSIEFIFKRVFPKLPIIKKIYFFLTHGTNRTLSRTEVLGRLVFSGFQIVSEKVIENKLCFICRKIDLPKTDKNPSYGPFIKLRRVGKDHKFIYTYKVRTMHPYSEYLQDYVHQKNDLEHGGKFKDDFRITGWGKLFRKMWIDELPQLLNFFRGELSLVGVRALSEHYFDLYPKEIQDLRVKYKPGLVPPYYADMPTNFEEILLSEEEYLKARTKAPFKTQTKYFCKAMYNIFFKHARSK